MRSTIELDPALVEEAKSLTKIKTKKELINLSLRELIKKKRRDHLISLFGSRPIDMTLEDLDRLREDGR